MWTLLRKTAKNDNSNEISFIDVKELYDAAYAEKEKRSVNLKRFNELLEQATKLDQAYRIQLGLIQTTRYEEAA